MVGKLIFAHCEIHLDDAEKRWLEEDVETNGFVRKKDNPLAKPFEDLEIAAMKETQQIKEKALSAAYLIVEEFWEKQKERRRYLPNDLLVRLESYEASLNDPDFD